MTIDDDRIHLVMVVDDASTAWAMASASAADSYVELWNASFHVLLMTLLDDVLLAVATGKSYELPGTGRACSCGRSPLAQALPSFSADYRVIA